MHENNKNIENNINIDSLSFSNMNIDSNKNTNMNTDMNTNTNINTDMNTNTNINTDMNTNMNTLMNTNINISNQLINSNMISNESFKKNIMKKGKIILKENDFFNDLDYIMSDDNFRIFYDKYFKDFSDVKIVLLYMKLYETIQKEYFEINNKEIEKELLAYIIKELMCDNFTRKNIMKSFNEYENNNNPKDKRFILDIFNKKNNIKQITLNKKDI